MNQRFENLKSSLGHSTVSTKPSWSYYSQLIEDSKYCIVGLETTYRDALEMNTTYLVGKTLEGETMLLPKQLIEQANIITMDQPSDDDDDEQQMEESHSKLNEHSHISVTDILKTSYSSHGNIVRCVTGSFN